MTRRHLRNIERTDARRVRTVTFHMSAGLINWEQAFAAVAKAIADTNRRDYVWPDSAETPTSGTETGQDGDEGGREAL